ncbi:response regulator [Risungbinella massiliensis]|uniref:response regulator n=1 Tax=Risungbinella massiliensis TaxID=1329796 RepID=UPI0005CC461B|nr:response regulator [Risungbinella massiliensis]
MIVEDDVRVMEIHKRFLQKMPEFHVCATAQTGKEAVEWLEVMQPQLVLLDLYLPDMLGTDLIIKLREQKPDLDVIMITAANETHMVQQSLQQGVFDFLVKPFLLERFQQSLESYLHSRSLLQKKELTQQEVDRFLQRNFRPFQSELVITHLPKGIDEVTLQKVDQMLQKAPPQGVTAEQASVLIGVSRTTARRYLEYLVASKKATADLEYGSIGRPERKYRATSSIVDSKIRS